MRVLVCGSTGCVGTAVSNALIARGHRVIGAARSLPDSTRTLHLDFAAPVEPAIWAARLRAARVDVVVNCVGILMESRGQTFDRVHARGPIELFQGAAMAGVQRVLQVSALGVGDDDESLDVPYLRTKLEADEALAAIARSHESLQYLVLRPSLVYGPRSQSGALFATLACLPLISLPGTGKQEVQPLHVYELAEAIARLIEQPAALTGVRELGGPAVLTYRAMLSSYRDAFGLGAALWLPIPLPVMRLTAWIAEAFPQRALCRATIRMLERGNVAAENALPGILGRAPTSLAQGLAISRPEPLVAFTASLSPALDWMLRSALASMWLYTAFVSALFPEASGVLRLLARCGFEGGSGIAMLMLSCALNLVLGLLTLVRPSPGLYAAQAGAVIGYTLTAAFNMPELTIDHCAPLAKNVPLLAVIMLLWTAAPSAGPRHARRVAVEAARRPGAAIATRSLSRP